MDKVKGSITRLCVGFAKLPSDLWHGRGPFSRLAQVSRVRLLLVECAVLVIVCGGYYLLRYEAAAARWHQALGGTSDQLRGVVLELEAERRELRAADARRALLARLMLDSEGRARLLADLTDPAAHPGLEIVSISPQPSETRQCWTRYRSLILLEGGFDDFLRFLRRLESEGSPCAVVALDVRSVSRTRGSGRGAVRDTGGSSGRGQQWRESISFLIETYAEAEAPAQGPAATR